MTNIQKKYFMNKFGLEYHLVDSCNLRCAGCSHYSSLLDKLTYTPLDKIIKEMSILKLKTNHGTSLKWLRLLGGEPLLHPELAECIKIIRGYFTETRITLVTNGLLLDKMPDRFYEECKDSKVEIQVTNYGIIDIDAIFDYIKAKNISIEVYRTCKSWYYRNIRLTDGDIDCFKNCYHKSMCPNYRNGKIFLCPQMAYIDIFNNCFNKNISINRDEYIDISDIRNFDDLVTALTTLHPTFCSKYCNCVDSNGNPSALGQRHTTQKNINEFCEL